MPFSSDQIIRAVERHDYKRKSGHGHRGSHRTWARPGEPGELHNTVTIELNKNRLPDGTVANICRQLGIDKGELQRWVDEK